MINILDIKTGAAFIFEHWTKFYTFVDIIGDVMGKKTRGDVPEELKGVYGLFGKEDERAISRLLVELPDEDRKLVVKFLYWHFLRHQDRSHVGAVTVWWFMNAWRTHVTRLSTPKSKTGTTTTKQTVIDPVNPKDKTETITTTENSSGGGNQSLDFLKKIAQIIKDAGPGNEVAGYEDVLRFFQASGVPQMPKEETLVWLESRIRGFSPLQPFIAVHNRVNERVQEIAERDKKRNPISRFIRKLL